MSNFPFHKLKFKFNNLYNEFKKWVIVSSIFFLRPSKQDGTDMSLT